MAHYLKRQLQGLTASLLLALKTALILPVVLSLNLNVNQLMKRYTARTLRALRTSLIFPSLCNRDYQAEFQGAYTVEIPNPVVDRDAEAVNRGDDWIDPTDASVAFTPRSLTKQSMMAGHIAYLDEMQVPVSLVDRETEIHTRGFASRIDKDIAGIMVAGVPAGQITTIDAANNPHINVDGSWGADAPADNTVAKQDAMMLALHNFLEGWIVSAINAGYGPDQMTPLRMWIVINPPVWRTYRNWLRRQNLSEDITTQLFLNGRLTRGPNGMVARIEDVIFLRSPNMPRVAGQGQNNGYWQVLAGTRRATSFASIPMLAQFFSPRVNQITAPGWLMRGTNFYDAWVTETTTLRLMRLPGPTTLTKHQSGLELSADDELILTAEDLAAQMGPVTLQLPYGASLSLNQPELLDTTPAAAEPKGKGKK